MIKFKTKLYIFIFMLFLCAPVCAQELSADDIFDIKQNAFALYNTNHIDEAFDMLIKVPEEKRDAETFLILANLEQDRGNEAKAITNLHSAIRADKTEYRAYYNLGCIFMKRKIFTLAIENFKNAVKYNKKNPYAYYNLGCAQMNLGEFHSARKNFIKAILLKNDEKNFYYNLAYINKKLGREKESKKIIDFYNQTFVK